MIHLTRLNGEGFVLNAELLQRVEGHPDTVVTLLDDTKYLVRESVRDVVRSVRDYRAGIAAVAARMDRGEQALPLDHDENDQDENDQDDAATADVVSLPVRMEG